MGYQGPLYTCCNKREEGLISKNLDRVLINEIWMDRFPQAYSVFEAGGCSDHLRGRIMLASETGGGRKPFKFSKVLTQIPTFMPMVENYWGTTTPLFISTSSMYRFSKKIKALKPLIRDLGKTHLSDLIKRTKEAYDQLCLKQREMLTNPTTHGMEEDSEAYQRWQHLADLEEGYFKQKSKLHWLNVGDHNNSYIYKNIQTRQMRNAIKDIRSITGDRLTDKEDIKAEAKCHFREFLTLKPSDF